MADKTLAEQIKDQEEKLRKLRAKQRKQEKQAKIDRALALQELLVDSIDGNPVGLYRTVNGERRAVSVDDVLAWLEDRSQPFPGDAEPQSEQQSYYD